MCWGLYVYNPIDFGIEDFNSCLEINLSQKLFSFHFIKIDLVIES